MKFKFNKQYLLFIKFFLISTFSLANCNQALNHSRIVIAGGSLTEIVYLLGQEKKLVGVDVTSKYPLSAKKLTSIGYLRNLSSEGILSLSPTLLLAEDDIGPPAVLNQLNKTSLETKIISDDYTMVGVKNKIDCIVSILNLNKNNYLFAYNNIKEKIKKIEEYRFFNKKKNTKILLILMMRGTSPIIAGKNTSGHGLISSLGLLNSMSEVDGWKPVSKEEIILSNPDYVIVTNRTFKSFSSSEDFILKTGLNFTNAGKNNNLIIEDGMALLGFGPRTLDVGIKISEIIAK
tara:strand:- start:186 stop:1055 length:870 start_codon:yes stop_codon:yes gene_type:complete